MKWHSIADSFYSKVFAPHAKLISLALLIIFISLFGTCCYQAEAYPHATQLSFMRTWWFIGGLIVLGFLCLGAFGSAAFQKEHPNFFGNFYNKVFAPHAKLISLALLIIFISLFGTCNYQEEAYPQTEYAVYETGEECCYADRDCHPCVESIPIWEPDNPAWVDFMRTAWFRGIVMGTGFATLAALVSEAFRNRKHSDRANLP